MEHGLKGFEACVFLDKQDRKMALLRAGMTVVRMDQVWHALSCKTWSRQSTASD